MAAHNISKTCIVADCNRDMYARDVCEMHYARLRRIGQTDAVLNMGNGATPEERFWSRVNKQGPLHPADTSLGRCWEWEGSCNPDGYGKMGYEGRIIGTHRLAWFFVKGTWPSSFLLHSCDNPKCCNTAHLREGTQSDNMTDAARRDRIWRGGPRKSHGR